MWGLSCLTHFQWAWVICVAFVTLKKYFSKFVCMMDKQNSSLLSYLSLNSSVAEAFHLEWCSAEKSQSLPVKTWKFPLPKINFLSGFFVGIIILSKTVQFWRVSTRATASAICNSALGKKRKKIIIYQHNIAQISNSYSTCMNSERLSYTEILLGYLF